MKQIEQQIIDLIDRSESILIMPSSPPDGDSLGSAVALYLSLRKIGKKVTVVCADPVPEVYSFLPMMKAVNRSLQFFADDEGG
jgi:bifunctional oligoribonuclease and PAP phosphatase NrnA